MENNSTIYFLTYNQLPLLPPAEIHVIEHLKANGLNVKIVNWDEWDYSELKSIDIVFLRSTWNYDQKPADFKQFLQRLKHTGAIVYNDIDLMLWNMNKLYMFEFQSKGLQVVPTYQSNEKELLLQHHPDCLKVIAKPVFSAGARGLLQLSIDEWMSNQLPQNAYICQPYLPSVADKGEWSLIYFDGNYSHAVLKRAKKGDFRVQSDHGGTVEFVTVPNDWIELGKTYLNACSTMPFFARIDLVLWNDNPALIELEIIEPELFVTDKQANLNFRDSVLAKIVH